MSELLKQAIIDSEALRKTAIENAHKSLTNHYGPMVEKVINEMLENDDEEIDIPFAFDDSDEEIDIDLTSLSQNDIKESKDNDLPCDEKCKKKLKEEDEQVVEEKDMNEDETCQECGESKSKCSCDEKEKEESIEENKDIDDAESILNALLEELETDLEPTKRGWLNTPTEENEQKEKEALATVLNDDEKKEKFANFQKALKQAHQEVNEERKLRQKYEKLLKEALNCLETSNIVQTILEYQNKVLSDISLNEQQKMKIVESISKTKTVDETILVYETLYKTFNDGVVANKPKNGKRNINEILSGKNPVTHIVKESNKTKQDPLINNWIKWATGKTEN